MEGEEEGQPRQQQQQQEVNILKQLQELRHNITEQLREVVRLLQPQQPQPLQGPQPIQGPPPPPPQGQGPLPPPQGQGPQPLQGPPPPPQGQGPQPLQGPPPYFVPPPQVYGWANSPVAMVIIYGNGYNEYWNVEMARAAPVNLGAGGPYRNRRQGLPYPNI